MVDHALNLLDWTLTVAGCTAAFAFLAILAYLPFAIAGIGA